MPFRQRDRRPGRERRSGSYVRAYGLQGATASPSGTGYLLTFNSSAPSFRFLGVAGNIHQQSETFVKTTEVSPVLKGAAKIDSRQKGSVFSFVPSYNSINVRNYSSFRRGVVGGGGPGASGWSGGGGGGGGVAADPVTIPGFVVSPSQNKFVKLNFTGSATVAAASGDSSLSLTDSRGVAAPTLIGYGGAAGGSSSANASGGGGSVPTVNSLGATLIPQGTSGPQGNAAAAAVSGWAGCGLIPSACCYAGGGGGNGGPASGLNGGAARDIYPLIGQPGSYVVGGGGGAAGWGPGVPYAYGDGWPVCPGRGRGAICGPGPGSGTGGTNAGPGLNNATANYGGGGGGGSNGGTGFPATAGTGGSGVCFLRIA